MIYLVQFDLERQDYPDDHSVERDLTRLVEAVNETDAHGKLVEHYEAQSSDYAVSYRVSNVRVHPTIA